MGKKKKKKKEQLTSQIAFRSSRDTLPEQMQLDLTAPGIHLGCSSEAGYAGIPQGAEGNLLVIGSHGSGKSQGVAMPTLATWTGTAFVIDVKGELSAEYRRLYQGGYVHRPYLIFDPSDISGVAYDPFGWLAKDGAENLVSNVEDLACSIIPTLPAEPEPFWTQGEQQTLAAALLHFYQMGLSFSEAVCRIMATEIGPLCAELSASDDVRVQMLIGKIEDNPRLMASIDRGLRNHLAIFATDPLIAHSLRGEREGAQAFTWDALENSLVFLRVPQDKLDVWSPALNLITTQLIRYLERRPEMYSSAGQATVPVLLLLDEVARLGKLPRLPTAMATLRSKRVNIAVFVQSLAQLDNVYGEQERRIILDNCPYVAVLRACDADTQRYLAELIGTRLRKQYGLAEQMDKQWRTTSYAWRTGEVRELLIQPHELASLNDVLVVSPCGFFRAEKAGPNSGIAERKAAALLARGCFQPARLVAEAERTNESAHLLSVAERVRNADAHIIEYRKAKHLERDLLHQERDIDEFLDKLNFQRAKDDDTPAHRRTAFLADLIRDQAAAKWIREREGRKNNRAGVIIPLKDNDA